MVERRRERGKEREKGEGGVDRCTRTFEIQSGTVGGTIDDDTIIKVSFDISLGNGPEWHHVSSMSRRLRRVANGATNTGGRKAFARKIADRALTS